MLDPRGETQLVHRVEDAALHRLLAVLHVGDRAAAHHAHGVGEIAPLGERRHVDEGAARVGLGPGGKSGAPAAAAGNRASVASFTSLVTSGAAAAALAGSGYLSG